MIGIGIDMFKKIDLFFNGDYLCSTNQSKTCKIAVQRYLELIEMGKYYSIVDKRIAANPKLLTANFDRLKRS